MGFVIPLPIIDRFRRVSRLVESLGWEAARDLSNDTFTGWEADLLPTALIFLKE